MVRARCWSCWKAGRAIPLLENALGRSPLVVVDDVSLVDGVGTLSAMRASDVQRIDILWPTEASFRYGNAGGSGRS
jgi:hypothetical protein